MAGETDIEEIAQASVTDLLPPTENWKVRSESNPLKFYIVTRVGVRWSCNCIFWIYQKLPPAKRTCKHIELQKRKLTRKASGAGLKLDPKKALICLKDFQRETVNNVFRRLYTDHDATRRFLIADEVGLGKTLVARGVIARAIEHLRDQKSRLNIVYICSNSDIASQNANRINPTFEEISDNQRPKRITFLPAFYSDYQGNKLNIIPLTPGTSFELERRAGRVEERVLLYHLVRRAWRVRGKGAIRLFQVGVQNTAAFTDRITEALGIELDGRLAESYETKLSSNRELHTRFQALCHRFENSRKPTEEDRGNQHKIIGELRLILAATCIKSLEPDIVILDEFQRFKNIMQGEDESARLAKELFEFTNRSTRARVILLSATPYKMYMLSDEEERSGYNHHEDFMETLRFLFKNDSERLSEIERLLDQYRRDLFSLPGSGWSTVQVTRQKIQTVLRKVMVRTERLSVDESRSGMLITRYGGGLNLTEREAVTYPALQAITRELGEHDTLEFWKSAPYLLNFMEEYKLKASFTKSLNNSGQRSKIARIVQDCRDVLLPWDEIRAYGEVEPINARLRALMSETTEADSWKLVWIPSALNYYELSGPFQEQSLQNFTKRLVFSAWRVVPKIIATMLSYDAERRMIRLHEKKPINTPEARDRRPRLLQFSRSGNRLAGMPIFTLMYPSIVLAEQFDPLSFSLERKSQQLSKAEEVIGHFEHAINELLSGLDVFRNARGPLDESWYWAAPVLLDANIHPEAAREWLEQQSDLATIWGDTRYLAKQQAAETASMSAWQDHVERLVQCQRGQIRLGTPPKDLARVLAEMALAAPATAALRALARITGGKQGIQRIHFRNAAAAIGWAFHGLFNLPEITSLIRGLKPGEPYWSKVLEYCVDGGLQAVLDEYAHLLLETYGLVGKNPADIVHDVSSAMRDAVSLRSVNLNADILSTPSRDTLQRQTGRLRCHYALRFVEESDSDGFEGTRREQVRTAFNSPFWPFVLATTSVGQEGLDFHPYCHAVVHWNLPSNPVDLEQREGRIHRYKGHAIRKNVALKYGLLPVQEASQDPWEALFLEAKKDRPSGSNDLVPYWVFDGPNKIERIVPILPLSRDQNRLWRLLRTLVVYRMAFGQSSQEDLVRFLVERLPQDQIERAIDELRIDLSPART